MTINRAYGVPPLLAALLLGFATAGWGQIITTVAGSGLDGDNSATQVRLSHPMGVAVDGAGNLYIADTGNARIRRVDRETGIITTIAGTGEWGDAGDGGPATQARISSVEDVTVDAAGHLYIADTGNDRIRRVDGVTGIITTVAGTGMSGSSGDGGPATQAQLIPSSVAVDGTGNLYITDQNNHRIRRVDARMVQKPCPDTSQVRKYTIHIASKRGPGQIRSHFTQGKKPYGLVHAGQLANLIRLFQPETVLKWHRELVRRKWTYRRKTTATGHLLIRILRHGLCG